MENAPGSGQSDQHFAGIAALEQSDKGLRHAGQPLADGLLGLEGARFEGRHGLGQERPVVLPVIGDQQPLHQDALADHLGEVARAAGLAVAVVLLDEAAQHDAPVHHQVVEGGIQHGAPTFSK